MARKVYEFKRCLDCGAGFNARGYPKQVAAWLYCERCACKHLDRPRTITITERDIHGSVLRVSTMVLGPGVSR